MKWSSFLSAAVAFLGMGSVASAASLELGGTLSYDNVEIHGFDDAFSGPSFTGVLTSSVYGVSAGTDLKLGFNLGYQSVSYDEGDVEANVANSFVGGLVGFDIAFTSRFKIQTLLGYDIGLSGESEFERNDVKTSVDVDEFRRLHYGFTGSFRVIPNLDVGMGIRWNQGYYELENATDDVDFRGFQLVASVMVPIL